MCGGNLLKRAGEVAALSFRPSEDGFIVNTTWRLRITCRDKHRNIAEHSIMDGLCLHMNYA